MLPVYELTWENTQPQYMCDTIFEKAADRRGKVNRITSVYEEAAFKRVLKKSAMRNFVEFKKIYVRESLFQKVKLCRSTTSLKMFSEEVFSCEIL